LNVPTHDGPPIEPSELWTAWNWDPLVWFGLLAAAAVYRETWQVTTHRRAVARWQRRSFVAGMAVVWLALVSPLDAMGSSLSSAHMVQHLLLTAVAAPLLVAGAPMITILRSLPRSLTRRVHRWRMTPAGRAGRWLLANPVAATVPSVVALWAWHVPVLYEAAVGNELVHRLEHATFVLTALVSWAAIVAAGRRRRDRPGMAVLVLFALSLQCGILGVLLAFSRRPWYPSYATATEQWGLTPLEDQQLAGVIMWIPAGAVYMVVALVLLSRWIGVGLTGAPHAGSVTVRRP